MRARPGSCASARLLCTLAVCCALGGCQRAATPVFQVELTVRSDVGAPVAGARASLAGAPAGTSDAEGRLALALRGREGERLEVRLECPPGFAADPERSVLILRDVRPLGGARAAPLGHGLRCRPTRREGVVIVHAEGAGGLPVALDGERVSTTDAHGFAHVYVSRAPGTRFELTLDTTERRELTPQSPRRTFALDDADALFVFEQRFEARRSRVSPPPAPPPPPVPTRLR